MTNKEKLTAKDAKMANLPAGRQGKNTFFSSVVVALRALRSLRSNLLTSDE